MKLGLYKEKPTKMGVIKVMLGNEYISHKKRNSILSSFFIYLILDNTSTVSSR